MEEAKKSNESMKKSPSDHRRFSHTPTREDFNSQIPTTYLDTLLHLFRGNVGAGSFSMAEAIKNGGIVTGGLLVILIATICVHLQHILIKAADFAMESHQLKKRPDYGKTIEICFLNSKSEKLQRMAPVIRKTCNFMICLTQIGFCSVFFVFVSSNVKIILDFYHIDLDIKIVNIFILIPIWLTSLVRELKPMVKFSAIANFFMIVGVIVTVAFATQDLPPMSERNLFPTLQTLPFFFGITFFSFEGIALVLPLKNSMKDPSQFGGAFGVLNVGMFFVTLCYFVSGEFGYWKYGEETKGSLTLNLPTDNVIVQFIILAIAGGVLLGYTLELFIAVQILLPIILTRCSVAAAHPIMSELIFRTILVSLTFIVAELVPNLTLLLSLVGSVFCSVLSFIFPILIDFVVMHNQQNGVGWKTWAKNIFILLFSIVGSSAGAYVSLREVFNQM